MATREFTDRNGAAWRVWSTVPAADSPLARYYPDGWLTFDCGTSTLRRMSPVPPNWDTASDERLQLMCKAAEEVPRHTGPIHRVERPQEGVQRRTDDPALESPPDEPPPELR
jgi:hypothetical protein